MSDDVEFLVGDSVVYPTHGVGEVTGEEEQVVGDVKIKLLVINFAKEKMVLRVPKNRATKGGLRHLSSSSDFEVAINVLRAKPKLSKGMWNKRAQEYEGKINSGNVKSIAEVLRDLNQNVDDPDRSYSEKMIYEAAFERFVTEFSIAEGMDREQATSEIIKMLEDEHIDRAA